MSAAGTFAPGGGSVTINPGDTAQQVAELLGAQLQISPIDARFSVQIEPNVETGDVSLVVQPQFSMQLDSFSITENVILSSDLQITSPSGFSLGSVELLGSEVAVDEGSVTQQISEARVAIPSQSELADFNQGADLRVDIFVDDVQVLDTNFRVEPGLAPQDVADQLRSHIEGQLNGLGEAQRSGFRSILRAWARMLLSLCCRRARVTSRRTLILRVRLMLRPAL